MKFLNKFSKFKYLFCIFILFALTPQHAEAIKIGLCTDCSQVYIASSVPATVADTYTGNVIMKLTPMKYYYFQSKDNQVSVKINSGFVKMGTGSVSIKTDSKGFLSTKKAWYRGNFILNSRSNSIVLINKLPLEEYLRGVVPSEMPYRWNLEALKAQAIVARSYAVANIGKRGSLGYDLNDTPLDQAYGGASAEKKSSSRAVSDTTDIVLVYNNKIIPAYYCASAGGQTLNSGIPWTHDLPYLKSVPSYDKNVKKKGHGVGMSQHGANNLAKMGYNAYSILNYFYNDIKFAKLSKSWNL